jgi:hypothetical protein
VGVFSCRLQNGLTRSSLRRTTLSSPAAKKEDEHLNYLFSLPSLPLAAERVDKRSDVGASQLYERQLTNLLCNKYIIHPATLSVLANLFYIYGNY